MSSFNNNLPNDSSLPEVMMLLQLVQLQNDQLQLQNDQLAKLETNLNVKKDALKMVEGEVKRLKELIGKLQRALYGRKSERYEDKNQLLLEGLMLEVLNRPPSDDEDTLEKETTVKGHTRKKKPGGRMELPDDLERVVQVIDVPESEKFLPDGTERPLIGYEDSERLAYQPSKYYVNVTRRPKYGSPAGAEEHGVVIAPLPERLLPRCMADESLLTYLIISKYVRHLPAYRLESMTADHGYKISRQTMCRWFVEVGLALEPVANEIKKCAFAVNMVHFDDTTVDLLEENPNSADGKRIRESRFWVGRSPPRAGPWTIYMFSKSREYIHIANFFEGYTGDIICDAYSGNLKLDDNVDEITLYGCWAHTRRYFNDAHKGDSPVVGAEFISLIRSLYMIERKIDDSSDEERLQMRQTHSVEILDAIRTKIDELLPITQPKTLLGKALGYANNNWERLVRFIDNPLAGIDNNPVENMVRPVALGRKNWLFIGNESAGRATANLLTILMTCKNAGDDPYEYLLDIMQRLPNMKTSDVHTLIPEHWRVPNQGTDGQQDAQTA